MTREQRMKTYTNAYIHFGEKNQLVVAIEELSECQKEICKVLRSKGDLEHLAEEIADAMIMLEQMQMYFGLEDKVNEYVDAKVLRLDRRLRGCAFAEALGK